MESQNDSDEDVILPNSPLYQFFDQPVEVDPVPPTEDEQVTFYSIIKRRVCGEIRDLAEGFVAYVDDFSNFFKTEHHRVQKRLFFNVFQFARSKKLLVSEDVDFMQSCLLDQNEYENVPKFSFSKLGIAIFLSFIILIISIGGLHMEAYMTLIECAVLRQIVRKISIFVAAFNVSCFCYWFFLLAYHIYRCSVVFNKAKTLCTNVHGLIDYLKKTYRIIQEFELIARGFTSTSVAHIVQRVELSTGLPIVCPNRQLPELRKSLFTMSYDIFMSYRSATCYLINISPITIEGTSQYFATIPLKEYGDLMKYNPKNDTEFEELLKVSDNLSLSALKAMHQLMTVQVSEFLKRFGLCFFHDSMNEINYFDTFEKLNKYVHLLEQTTKCDSKILCQAKQAYVLYRNMDFYSRQHDSIQPISKSPLYSFKVMIQDLNIHIKSVLMKAIAVEDDLIKESETLEQKSLKDSSLPLPLAEKLLSCFKEIESEIAVISECVVTCTNNISSNLTAATPKKNKIDEPVACEADKNAKPQCTPVLIDAVDPVIEDEVLEAIAHPEPSHQDDACSAAESDDVVMDRKITKNLMQELKKILVVKAEEHRCREEKAIRAKIAKEGTSSESIKLDEEPNQSMEADSPLSCGHENNSDTNEANQNDDCNPAVLDSGTKKPTSSEDDLQPYGQKVTDKDSHSYGDEHVQQDLYEPLSENILRMRFSSPGDNSFAQSIAAMASQRQQMLNLRNDTYEFEEVLGDDSEEED